jgi:hypothetical protein
MALQPFVAPWPLFNFLVGLLGWGISPSQGRYLHKEQYKHRINVNTDIHALSGIRTHDPSVPASEDRSCLRPCGHCVRRNYRFYKPKFCYCRCAEVTYYESSWIRKDFVLLTLRAPLQSSISLRNTELAANFKH